MYFCLIFIYFNYSRGSVRMRGVKSHESHRLVTDTGVNRLAGSLSVMQEQRREEEEEEREAEDVSSEDIVRVRKPWKRRLLGRFAAGQCAHLVNVSYFHCFRRNISTADGQAEVQYKSIISHSLVPLYQSCILSLGGWRRLQLVCGKQ